MKINEETLLKPIRAQTDKIMMITLGVMLVITLGIGWFYDVLLMSMLIAIPAFVVPFFIWRAAAGSFLLRLAIATALVIDVAIHIQASHGLIEMHFGVFTILAFLLAYRDWRIIVYAASLIAVHHLALNFLQAANYNVWIFRNGADFGIVTLHASFVVFEAVILVLLALQFKRELVHLATVSEIAERIAEGDLSVRIIDEDEDFVNVLFHSMQKIQDALNSFVQAQQNMTKKHKQGFISERIDVSKLPGAYGEIATAINELVQSHIDVKMHIVDVVTQYGHGNFDVNIDRLPEEKAKITTAIDSVKTALLSVNGEIKMLAFAGAQGDFSKRSNVGNYEFMFKDMLTHLNNLVETCDGVFNDVLRMSTALAQGDLTQQITEDYTGMFGNVKDGMNGTVDNLKALVGEIKDSTDTINTASQEIAAGNNDLSQRTEQQAASLEQTVVSMQELTATVQENSENAKYANDMALSSSDIARKGVAVVKQVVETMQDINDSSRKVVDIITVIDGIAFQTNILALNAAVEAARAGEQGRGFAVVASEVRNLAQRAAGAAGEIKALIRDSVDKVEDGTNLVAKAGKTMEEIVNSIQGVSATISKITDASFEQTTGIQQVNQAIGEMDEVTQQNAALVEEAAAAAEALENQARNLSITMGNFKINDSKSNRQNTTVLKTTSAVASAPVKMVARLQTPIMKVTDAIDIDLDGALKKHAEWKIKFRTAISQKETLDVTTISKDNCCDFGKWLHSEDTHPKIAHLPSYHDCVKEHATFHIEAGKVAAMINDRKYDQAETLLLSVDSGFANASIKVGSAIMRLKKDTAPKPVSVASKSVTTTTLMDDWEEF